MNRWRSRSDSHRFPPGVEREGALAGPAAGVRWSDAYAIHAFERVWTELIANISGDRWKLADTAIEELRAKRYHGLLMPRRR